MQFSFNFYWNYTETWNVFFVPWTPSGSLEKPMETSQNVSGCIKWNTIAMKINFNQIVKSTDPLWGARSMNQDKKTSASSTLSSLLPLPHLPKGVTGVTGSPAVILDQENQFLEGPRWCCATTCWSRPASSCEGKYNFTHSHHSYFDNFSFNKWMEWVE